MPLSAFELEFNSLTRWLSDTIPEATVEVSTIPAQFTRPTFFVESPRANDTPVNPGARQRNATANVVYFGKADITGGTQPWLPLAMAGKLEEALNLVRHRIPRRDATGAQVGILRITEFDWSQRSGSDTDLTITFRWLTMVWDYRPELDGLIVDTINIRKQ